MCGIAGFLEPGGLRPDSETVVASMAGALAHRGPDHSGIWLDKSAGLAFGHQRLAILDLSAAGNQPMVSPRGRYVITYNGEIYNFEELRQTLTQNAGIAWSSNSDTEVLLAAVEHWGIKGALARLNGMFAFALFDRQTRVLTLARDRMGEKPLYYGSVNGIFLFGSELKALQAHPAFKSRIDESALSAMFRYDYIPAPRTIWKDISKLPAGHHVDIASDGAVGTVAPYWKLEDCASPIACDHGASDDQLVDDFDRLLKDSVKIRMLADVPVGAFLSGGIDSSLIVALMQTQSAQPVRTFTIGFEEVAFDEAPRAKAVAQYLGTDHTELYVTSKDALELIPSLPKWWDEPFGDSSQIPTLLVSKLSRESVKVALSGDGGDELFGGYSRFHAMNRLWNLLRMAPLPIRSATAALLDRGEANPLIKGWTGRASKILNARHLEELYHWRVSRMDEPERLFRRAPMRQSGSFGPVPFLCEPVEKMMYLDSKTYLPEDILTKVDRASMAVSLEVRAPFLDHRVVESSWRLPFSQRFTSQASKPILRAIGRRYLPPEVLERPKLGFCVPIQAWLRGPLRSWAEDLLSDRRLRKQDLFEVQAIREIWNGFLLGKKHHERIIWNILMFQVWAEHNCGI